MITLLPNKWIMVLYLLHVTRVILVENSRDCFCATDRCFDIWSIHNTFFILLVALVRFHL
uniref:Uncharacterized protein n=1 Tax=Arundo donax TaxID=35708 RepID=A0A0A9FA85_ARUDO